MSLKGGVGWSASLIEIEMTQNPNNEKTTKLCHCTSVTKIKVMNNPVQNAPF